MTYEKLYFKRTISVQWLGICFDTDRQTETHIDYVTFIKGIRPLVSKPGSETNYYYS